MKMELRNGMAIESDADRGIILEKYWNLSLTKEILEKKYGVSSLETIMNKSWGEEVLYFKSNENIFVFLTGEGSPNAASCVERLYRQKVKSIVSLGTSGSTSKSIKKGDYIVSLAGIRDDRVTHSYLDSNVPAIADLNLTLRINDALNSKGYHSKIGVTYSTDARFKENPDLLNKLSKHAKVLNVDMETATILLIGSYFNIPTTAVNIITDSAIEEIDGDFKGVFHDFKSYDTFIYNHYKKLLLTVLKTLDN